MRSSPLAGLGVALAVAAGGCDLVFGVGVDAAPCGDESFAGVAPVDLAAAADMASVSWAQDRIVYSSNGFLFERALPDGEPAKIDVTQYPPTSLALAPEGDAIFLASATEPPILEAAVRGDAGWALDGIVPVGAMAGAPSAAEFGPRRVIVRLRMSAPDVQEYEADGNRWRPVGDPHPVPGSHGPNLTPSGLDLLYDISSPDEPSGDAQAVYIAHRASTDDWFGDPVVILPGLHVLPQLLGGCRRLYVTDFDVNVAGAVRRYDR